MDMDDTNLEVAKEETSSHNPHPLLLPEILWQIAPMLSQPTILCCVLVCKTWHTCLMPFIFQRINLPRRKQLKRSKFASRPLIATIIKNASSIRTLISAESHTILRQITPYCTGVETLVIGNITPEVLSTLRFCKDTLVQLELIPERKYSPPSLGSPRHIPSSSLLLRKRYSGILEAILGLSKLKHLVLDHLRISDEAQLLSFLEFCTQLTSLELHNNAVESMPIPETLELRNMRSLCLVNCPMPLHEHSRLLLQCPSLDHLTWIHKSQDVIYVLLSSFLKDSRQRSQLKSLDISSCISSDELIHFTFSHLTHLEKLVAQESQFGPLSLVALLDCLKDQIRLIDLAWCQAVTPEMIIQIMESCPSLKSLSADRLRANDIMESSNRWVCHGLEELRVVVTGPSFLPSYETRHAIYNQIATLKQLRVLNLGRYSAAALWVTNSILDLSLAGGFGQLRTLKELRVFDFCQLNHKLTMEEFKFMLKSWPKLEVLHGQLSTSLDRADFIESFLKNERPWLRVKSSMRFERRTTRTDLS